MTNNEIAKCHNYLNQGLIVVTYYEFESLNLSDSYFALVKIPTAGCGFYMTEAHPEEPKLACIAALRAVLYEGQPVDKFNIEHRLKSDKFFNAYSVEEAELLVTLGGI